MSWLKNKLWLRWTLICEYPKRFFKLPALLWATAAFLWVLGYHNDDILLIIAGTWLGYSVAIVGALLLLWRLLFLRPDKA